MAIKITTNESILLETKGCKCEEDVEIIVEGNTASVWDKKISDYVEEDISIPTDLTEYQVDVPAGWSASSGYGDFDIYNSLNHNDYLNNIYNAYFGIGKFVSFDAEWLSGSVTNVANSCSSHADSAGFPPFTNFSPTQSFTLYISGGLDVDEPKLIQWFVDNGATFNKVEEEVPTEATVTITNNATNVKYTAYIDINNKNIAKVAPNSSATITVPIGTTITISGKDVASMMGYWSHTSSTGDITNDGLAFRSYTINGSGTITGYIFDAD